MTTMTTAARTRIADLDSALSMDRLEDVLGGCDGKNCKGGHAAQKPAVSRYKPLDDQFGEPPSTKCKGCIVYAEDDSCPIHGKDA